MTPCLLDAKELCCGYPGRLVLDGVSFELRAGEVVVLLGQNGSGKSTLLKTLVKVVPLVGGTVRVQGIPQTNLDHRDLAAKIAFVPQEEHSTFPFLARQMVMMGRIPHSLGFGDTHDDHSAVEQAMADADCLEYADRPITELSGGERQRVLIARALASQAPILLLDEPSSHLDAAHVVGLVKLLRDLAKEGRAVIAAIHDLNVASILGDRAFLLGGCRLHSEGPVREVLESRALDDVYGIHFERFTDASGHLRVFPTLQ